MLKIQLLGDFMLTHNGAPVTGVNTARLQSLLAYLALHRNAPQPRRQLAFLLWPDSTEAQALTNLRKAVHHLRRALPQAQDFLAAGAKTVQWKSDAPFTLDVTIAIVRGGSGAVAANFVELPDEYGGVVRFDDRERG